MTIRHSESAFETVIEAHLLQNAYVKLDRDGFDCERVPRERRAALIAAAVTGQINVEATA